MRRASLFVGAILLVLPACSNDGPTAATDGPSPGVVAPGTTSTPGPTSTPTTSSPRLAPPPVVTTSTTDPTSTSNTGTSAPPRPATTVPIDEVVLALEVVADGFVQPVLAIAPLGDPRLFVVDQPGRIWVIETGEVREFLDISDAVRFRGEQGLLGLAFHPAYGQNGLFYVDFSDDRGDSVLAEFRVDPSDRNVALAGSRRDVLRIAQPAANHNGGMIAFGPDGLLWFGLGDGGGSNDGFGNGQRADSHLGSMIRIEVGPGEPLPFGAPIDGPFVEAGGLGEVWSIGLRNPWRWAFDGSALYIADVGQNTNEEINVVPADRGGVNFGWPILEGNDCFRSSDCDRSGLWSPALSYTHQSGCSITGGFVYRGSAVPELVGHYFYGDFCGGWVASIVVDVNGVVEERHEWFTADTVPGLTSFGIDAAGEVYVMTTAGVVYRIVRG